MREYDQIAAWYTAVRDPAVGAAEVGALARALPAGARVLDVGCGDGVPVSEILIRAGLDVAALDSSAAMVERYRARFPGVPVRRGRVERARFAPGSFAAVVAWGVLFHLDPAAQAEAIRRVGGWLAPGGRFLFTAGEDAGEAVGTMDGVAFRYVSLGLEAYRGLLAEAGMRLEAHHADAWDNHAVVAVRTAGTP